MEFEECHNCGREIDQDSEETYQSTYGDALCEDCFEEDGDYNNENS